MGCRGVHFALANEEAERLLAAAASGEAVDYLEEGIEEQWNEDWLVETDKAWDAIHRCLTDGTLKQKARTTLSKCILGGTQLHRGNDYIISFLTPEEVKEVSAAISAISNEWFAQRYWSLKKKRFLWLDLTDYGGPIGSEDLEYSLCYLDKLKVFFQRAAMADRAVVFSVDQ